MRVREVSGLTRRQLLGAGAMLAAAAAIPARADPIAGFDLITNNLNLRTNDGTPITFRDIAWYVAGQTPDQLRATRQDNTQSAISHQLAQLRQQQMQLAKMQQQMHYEHRFRQTRSAVDRYAETHPRLDELAILIERELKLGFDLDTAYRRADRLFPAGTAAAAQTGVVRAAAAQTGAGHQRNTGNTDRSISGAPAAANGALRRPKPRSRREAIANAVRSVRGGL